MTYDPFGTSTPADGSGYDPLKDARLGSCANVQSADIFGSSVAPVQTPQTVTPRPHRGQPAPLSATIMAAAAVVIGVLAGAFAYAALEGIRLADFAATRDRAMSFGYAVVVMLVLGLILEIAQVVMLTRARSAASLVGIVVGLVLPVISIAIGLRTGASALVTQLRAEVPPGADLTAAFAQALSASGVDPGWVDGVIAVLIEVMS